MVCTIERGDWSDKFSIDWGLNRTRSEVGLFKNSWNYADFEFQLFPDRFFSFRFIHRERQH